MEAWREKLDKYFNGDLKLFEEDYKITYPCILRRDKKKIRARIDMENKVVYSLDGEVLKRC